MPLPGLSGPPPAAGGAGGDGGGSIFEATELPVDEALAFFNGLELTGNQQLIAAQILKEIRSRLGFLQSVGLSYLTLSRAGTLSGGESQRIRLATQIGSSPHGRAVYSG